MPDSSVSRFDDWPVYPDGIEGVTIHRMPEEAVGAEVRCDGCGQVIVGNALGVPGVGVFHVECEPEVFDA